MRIYDAAFYIAALFILGIAGASLGINIYLTLLVGLTTLVYLKTKGVIKPLAWLGILFLSLFAGFFHYNIYSASNKESVILDKEIIFTGVIYKESREGQTNQELDLKLEGDYKGVIRVYTALYPIYNYGDFLEIRGKITKSPRGLNIVSFPKIKLIRSGDGSRVKPFLFSIKNKLVRNLERILSAEKSAFLAGVLFGERTGFSEDFREALKKSGTTHLVALSGYNISIIALSLSNVLSYFWNRRRAFWASLIFILSFVLMTGAEESVVRAAIMGMIFLIAERSSRLYSARNGITLTAFTMLLANPKLLVFNVGFQLSFLALIGIIYLKPALEKFFKIVKKETFLNWRENLLQTFSAQIAVLPITLTAFGYFSPLSLFSNVLMLEFMPMTMFLGFITAFAGLISYYLSLTIAWGLSVLLGYEIFIINFFGARLS